LLTVGGNALMQLLCVVLVAVALVYGALLALDLLTGRELWRTIAGSREEYRLSWKLLYLDAGEHPLWSRLSIAGFVASVLMLLSNFCFIAINLLACRRRGYGDLWLAALLSPLYWLMASIAAWKGAIQLLHNPHYWEKTEHGISKVAPLLVCLLLSGCGKTGPVNLLSNGSFEGDFSDQGVPSGWESETASGFYKLGQSGTAHDGQMALVIAGSGGETVISTPLGKVAPGMLLRLTGWIQTELAKEMSVTISLAGDLPGRMVETENGKWTSFEVFSVAGETLANETRLVVKVHVRGEGLVRLDGFSVVSLGETMNGYRLENAGFEADWTTAVPPQWFPNASATDVTIARGGDDKQGHWLEVAGTAGWSSLSFTKLIPLADTMAIAQVTITSIKGKGYLKADFYAGDVYRESQYSATVMAKESSRISLTVTKPSEGDVDSVRMTITGENDEGDFLVRFDDVNVLVFQP